MTNKTIAKRRLSRYVPDKGAFRDLQLRERDHRILRLVYEHRFLDAELLLHLLAPEGDESPVDRAVGTDGRKRPVRYAFGEQALSKRLKQLFNARYLERHYLTDQPMGRGHGAPRAIYGLGPASSRPLEETAGIPTQLIRRIVESNKVKSPFLRHALELAGFKVTLELACRKSEGRVRLLFWVQGDAIRDYVIVANERGEDERLPVHADAFFGLEVGGIARTHFFLEIDRGTEPIISSKQRTDIRRKLIAYRAYRKSGGFSQRYAYRQLPGGQIAGLAIRPGDDDAAHLLLQPITGFQVLFVTPGAIEENGTVTGRLAGILAELPSLGRFFETTSLFWFTPPESVNVREPERILSRCWITPNPKGGFMSMVE